MHGGSVNRTASVSKAVAAVLALRMDAKHPEFSLADKVRNDGIVVAVLTNRWKGGHSAAGLSKKIGEAMLAG